MNSGLKGFRVPFLSSCTFQDNVLQILSRNSSQLNALNSETIKELNHAIILSEENQNVRCILLTGRGTKAFVAGADIKEFVEFNSTQGEELSRKGQELLFDKLEKCSKPTIAAINGFALGGGLELAMSCHIRVASTNSKMGLPEVSLGVIPGYGGTQRLSNLVGKGKAMEMVFTAGMITAEEAFQCGLVNSICEQEDLIPTCEKIASKICRNSGVAISSAIKAINASFNDGINGYEVEKKEFGNCFGISCLPLSVYILETVSYTHLRAHET